MKDDLVPGNLERADDKKDKVVFVPKEGGMLNMASFGLEIHCPEKIWYDIPENLNITMDELGMWPDPSKPQRKIKGIECILPRRFWFSIVKAKDCIFSRRIGKKGKIILGYSIRLRLFNINII